MRAQAAKVMAGRELEEANLGMFLLLRNAGGPWKYFFHSSCLAAVRDTAQLLLYKFYGALVSSCSTQSLLVDWLLSNTPQPITMYLGLFTGVALLGKRSLLPKKCLKLEVVQKFSGTK